MKSTNTAEIFSKTLATYRISLRRRSLVGAGLKPAPSTRVSPTRACFDAVPTEFDLAQGSTGGSLESSVTSSPTTPAMLALGL
jgi:hypothetical protein